jgi:hypothetical protein
MDVFPQPGQVVGGVRKKEERKLLKVALLFELAGSNTEVCDALDYLQGPR